MSQAGIIALVGASVPSNVPINFVTNAGTATSVANVINIVGAGGTTTSGVGNTVTIMTVASNFPWTDEAIGFAAASNNGYFVTAAATATLPALPSQGNVVIIEADTAGAVVVQANAGQTIRLGTGTSSVAGSATSSKIGDSLYLVYRSASSTWNSISTEGTWGLS
jgi:hypothetical protein